MNERPDTPLDRLIAALARKAVAEHLARVIQPHERESDASAQENPARRAAA